MAALTQLILVLLSHIFIINRLNFFPYPELFVYPYLRNIGLVPYSQILDQHFPGIMFLPINLDSLGFNTPGSIFILHISLIIINHLLIYFIARSLLKDKKLAIFANIFYLLWNPYTEGNVLWIDSFLPLMLLPAFYFFKKANYYKSAFFMGFALLFKQVVLPLIILLSLYIWIRKKDFKKAFIFGLISGIPMALASFSYLLNGNFQDLFYWTVTFNLTTFADMGRKHIVFNEILKMIAIFGPAVLFLSYSVYKKKFYILAIFLFGSLFFAYARFDFVHIQPSLVFVSIIMSLIIQAIPKSLQKSVIIIYILIFLFPITNRLAEIKGSQTLYFTEQEFEMSEVTWLHAKKGDTIFVMGTTPHLYYLTRTRPPSDIFVFQFPWFMVEAEERVLVGIVNDPPKIVFRDQTAQVQGMNLVEHMPNINQYISQNYTIQGKIGNIEILIPNENSN